MDDDAQLERDLLLAHRLKVAVRLVIYPLLVGGVFLALHIHHAQAHGGEEDVRVWKGAGDGIRSAEVGVDDVGVAWVKVDLTLSCEGGGRTTFTYTPSNLGQTASAVSARRVDRTLATGNGATQRYSASVELPLPKGSAPVTGTASVSEVFTLADGRTVACGGPRSRSFTVRRQ